MSWDKVLTDNTEISDLYEDKYRNDSSITKLAVNIPYDQIDAMRMQTEKKADYNDALSNAVFLGGPQSIIGGIGAHRARKEMREAGMSEQEINAVSTHKGGMARGLGRGFGYGAALPITAYIGAKAYGPNKLIKKEDNLDNLAAALVLGGHAVGGIRAYKGEKARGRRAIEAYKKKKGSEMASMSKEAGLFMRPSDIADHTNLARALEDKLNGVSAEPQFKTAGISNSQYAGATIGGVAGYKAHKRAQNREVRDLAPEEVKGVRGKLRKVVNKAQKAQTRFAKESPKTSATVHSIAGGVAGATVGAPASKTVSRILRRR